MDCGYIDSNNRFVILQKDNTRTQRGQMIKVLYFAWVRERIGVPYEMLETRSGTVMELVEELKQKEERYEVAFSDLSALKVAVDQELCEFDAELNGALEVAFFPPMTGG